MKLDQKLADYLSARGWPGRKAPLWARVYVALRPGQVLNAKR
jgi:hypothetical protein